MLDLGIGLKANIFGLGLGLATLWLALLTSLFTLSFLPRDARSASAVLLS